MASLLGQPPPAARRFAFADGASGLWTSAQPGGYSDIANCAIDGYVYFHLDAAHHDLVLMASRSHLDACDFANAETLVPHHAAPSANASGHHVSYYLPCATAGATYHLSCSIGDHCTRGQRLSVTVSSTEHARDPTTGEVYAFIPRGHNFGLGSAPNTYSAKPEFVCAVARRLFAAIVDHYVDDYASCEPQFALGPARQHVVKALRRPSSTQGVLFMTAYMLGAPVSAMKHQPWSQRPEFIGVVTDMTDIHRDAIRLWCKPATREKVSRLIAGYMRPGADMTPGQAASLHGKCGWAMLRARMGRSALGALITRQYRGLKS